MLNETTAMRLINTESLQFEEVVSHEMVKYAILSHTWGEEEVSLQDFQDISIAREKKGFSKIEKTCELARLRNIKYAWVDTCCIDKTSSAELSEAINSMYRWYHDAEICFAYLSDMPVGDVPIGNEGSEALSAAFRACKWFTRGWTLQELVAPRTLEFYNWAWLEFGTKESLASLIEDITRIPRDILSHEASLESIAIGRRMSWASKRHTTRSEDMAYSLMGIFDINMPMLYGEGSKAFIRLQEEIFRQSNDLSLLAWEALTGHSEPQGLSGAFAQSPSDFDNCVDVCRVQGWIRNRNEVAVTSKGVRLERAVLLPKDTGLYLLLDCAQQGSIGVEHLGIKLRQTADGYCKDLHSGLEAVSLSDAYHETIYLRKTISRSDSRRIIARDMHLVRVHLEHPLNPTNIIEAAPSDTWDRHKLGFLWQGGELMACVHISLGCIRPALVLVLKFWCTELFRTFILHSVEFANQKSCEKAEESLFHRTVDLGLIRENKYVRSRSHKAWPIPETDREVIIHQTGYPDPTLCIKLVESQRPVGPEFI